MFPEIEMLPVESSQIHSIGHDPETSTLAIRFKSHRDGSPTSLYHYRNVDAGLFSSMKGAKSVGSWFYQNLKPNAEDFPYTRVEHSPGNPVE